MATDFKITLALPKSVRRGTPVRGTFTLTNLSAEAQRVLTWNTPLEKMASPCFSVMHAGRRIPYDGRYAARIPVPPPEAYVDIAAGGAVSSTFDLSDAYHLDATGTYEVKPVCEIVLAGGAAANVAGLDVPTLFELVDGEAAPLMTEGMRNRMPKSGSDGAGSGTPTTPTIVGGTTDQIATISTAWTNTYALQGTAIAACANSAYSGLFAKIFQVPATSANTATASGYYSQMQTAMQSSTFTLNILATQDSPGVIAYTYFNSTQIYFEPLFFTYCPPTAGDFSQPAITLHELSHAVCSIPDCSDAIACSYCLQYFAAKEAPMEYTLTLPMGNITVRNGIFRGSQTTASWAPCDPDLNGGWQDGDELNVVCTFNLNPPITPQPPAGEYAGLCVGACSDTDQTSINALISMAQSLIVPNTGQILTLSSMTTPTITTSQAPVAGNIFYGAQSTAANFTLTPSSRGTLTNYIYQWVMYYNGTNNVVADGTHVEIVFGYGDPMYSEVDS